MDYKFRGKLKTIGQEGDGDWVYGDHCKITGRHYIVPEYADCEWQEEDVWEVQGLLEVDAASVGMWTGWADEDKEDVYGGDFLRWYDEILEVRWGKGQFVLFSKLFSTPVLPDGNEVEMPIARGYFRKSKVIGNTTDNPELLEGK